jgi:hypothetical protein
MNIKAVEQNVEPNAEEESDGSKLFFIIYALHQLFGKTNHGGRNWWDMQRTWDR